MRGYVLATPVFNEIEALPGLLECIEAQLKDLGPAWEAISRPYHPLDDEDERQA